MANKKDQNKKEQHGAHEKERVTAKNITEEDRAFLEEHADGLSKTTVRYARWIHSTDEHAERPGQSLATRSHEVIRQWAEARGGAPATVPGTEHDDHLGVLRFDFAGGPDKGSSRLEHVDWEEWFRTFDERQLVFIYQEHKADGSESTFFRLDSPEREDG